MRNRIEQAGANARMTALRAEREAIRRRKKYERLLRQMNFAARRLDEAENATPGQEQIAALWFASHALYVARKLATYGHLRPTKRLTALERRYGRVKARANDGEAALSGGGTGIASIVTLKAGVMREKLYKVH